MSRKNCRFHESLEHRLMLAGQLIKDVNPAGDVDTTPPVLFQLNSSTALFVHDDGVSGAELWRTNGTPGGTLLVKDITPGSGGSGIGGIAVAENGTGYFVVGDGTNQSQLWKTDGSTGGTVLVKDFSGFGFGPVSQLTAGSTGAYFVMRDSSNGDELWKTDGSGPGTTIVEDINPGVAGSAIDELTHVGNNKVMFSAVVTGSNTEPWVSDGTAPGTFALGELNPGNFGTFPENFTPIGGGVVIFDSNAQPGTNSPIGIWRTDGTVNGTFRLHGEFGTADLPGGNARIANLTQVGSTVYFTISNNTYDRLWKTDGTVAGTTFAANIRENFQSPFTVREMTNVNGTLYFAAAGSQAVGYEPWKSDGTQPGTTVLADIAPGALYSTPEGFTFANGRVYFFADDNTNGGEVYSTTGTGAALAKDIYVGPESSLAGSFVTLNGQIYFTARNVANGSAIWTSDGTSGGTTVAVDLPEPTQSSNPGFIGRATDGDVFFSVEDTETGHLNLWRTDGTDAGTIELFRGNTFIDVRNAAVVGNNVFFVGTDVANGTELWKSDGTLAGTVLVEDMNSGTGGSAPTALTSAGGKLYFSNTTGDVGVWVSDGTPGGTSEIATNQLGTDFTAFGAHVYYRVGNSMWRTDGVTASAFGSSYTNMAVSNGFMYFAGNEGTNGIELWKTDGTTTGIVKNLVTGAGDSIPRLITPFGNGVAFIAYDNAGNLSAYKSDGTDPGTFILGSTGSEFDLGWDTIEVVNNRVFFLADNPTSGIEMWVSAGNANDAQLLKDINAGPGDSRIEAMIAGADGRLYFGADDDTHGRELWSSDGTNAGTRLEQDINPGAASSDPQSFVAAPNGTIYFSADDGLHGAEPWSFVPQAAFASIVNRVLTISGTASSDIITLTFSASPAQVTVNRNGSALVFALADFDSVTVNADAGDDSLGINGPSTLQQQPITFNGGAGSNGFTVFTGRATLANDVGANGTLSVVGVGPSGDLTINTSQHLQNLMLEDGIIRIAGGGDRVIVTKMLEVSSAARLDLNDNDLIVDYDTASPRGAIQTLINQARSGGTWIGNGITSTAARNSNPKNRTLGVLEATEFQSIYGQGALFSGEAIDNTAVLVKFTYYGDADFNGTVNFDDYARIDLGFSTGRTGWLNGDFDGNGSVNFDDYALIDLAFNTQGQPLRPGTRPSVGKLKR